MLQYVRVGLVAGVAAAAVAGTGYQVLAQGGASMPPVNEAANPYQTVENYFKLPDGRTWGSTSAVDIDKDGKTIWVAERCSANSCWDAAKGEMSPLDTVLKFDTSGKLLLSTGKGLMIFPHGIHVDRDGNIWVTDGQDNLPRRRPGAPADAPLPPAPAKVIGHQVHKFSPDGKHLMSLGKPGGNQPGQPADPGSFYQPNDVITYPNGDILVAEGHGNAAPSPARLIRFDKTGKFLREFGKLGTGTEGEFMQPHGLAFDSRGRLFVADRSNNRIQILDRGDLQDTRHLVSVQPPQRDLHRQERCHLRRRLRVGVGEPAARRLAPWHPDRIGEGRQGHRLHPRPDQRGRDLPDGGRQAGDEEGRWLARRHGHPGCGRRDGRRRR